MMERFRAFLPSFIVLIGLALVSIAVQPALAASIVVNSTADNADGTDGACTLREAIIAANTDTISGGAANECAAGSGVDNITFSVTGTIDLTNSLPAITEDVYIEGTGADELIIDGNDQYRPFIISTGIDVEISALEVFDANTTGGANGIFDNSGTLRVQNVLADSSFMVGAGAVLYNRNGASLTVINSTLSSTIGTAVINDGGVLTLINTTISGSPSSSTAAVRNRPLSTMAFIHSSLVGNYAGILNQGDLTITNTVIAGGTDSDCTNETLTGVITPIGINLIEDGSCSLAGALSGDPSLGALQVNGGSVPTHKPDPGSLLIDNGDNNAVPNDIYDVDNDANTAEQLPTDARGFSRQIAVVDIGAVEVEANGLSLIVNTTSDGTPAADALCTLREAILMATAVNPTAYPECVAATSLATDTISFSVTGIIALSSTLPNLSTDMIIDGSGADVLTVRGGIGSSPVLTVSTATTSVEITSLNVDGGNPTNIVNRGTLLVDDSLISNGFVTSSGGGIFNDGAILTLVNSAIVNNRANFGAGISNRNNGTVTAVNVTISGNQSGATGAGIFSEGTLNLYHVTISDNELISPSSTPGVGIFSANGTSLNVTNSIIANSTGAADCALGLSVTVNAFGTNLVEDGSCSLAGALSGDPGLLPLAHNGGGVLTHALAFGSPARDAGDISELPSDWFDADEDGDALEWLSTDARGVDFPRVLSSTVDIGAFEYSTPDLVVDRLDDADVRGCTSAPNDCTLRGAINLADSDSIEDEITFNVTGTITVGTLPDIMEELSIQGPGSENLTIATTSGSYVFRVGLSGELFISNLAIDADFGAVLIPTDTHGFIKLTSVNVIGGAVNATTGGEMSITSSRIQGAVQSSGLIYIANSTVREVQATSANGSVDLLNATVTGAGGTQPTSVYAINNGTVMLGNTLIAGTSAPNCAVETGGEIESEGGNLSDDATCAAYLDNTGDLNNVDAMLDPAGVTDNGGDVPTVALLVGSPAVNAGLEDNIPLVFDESEFGDPTPYDARGVGFPRVLVGRVDIGAFELNYTPDFVVDRLDDADVGVCSSTVNDCTLRGAINAANEVAGQNAITFSVTGTITIEDLPIVSDDLIVDGPGAPMLMVVSSNEFSIFFVDNAADLLVRDLSLNAEGIAVDSEDEAHLTLHAVDVVSGGVYIGDPDSTVLIENSHVAGVTISFGGVSIHNSTLGGIRSHQDASVTVENSTITGLTDSYFVSAVLAIDQSTITLANTLIAGNTLPNCFINSGSSATITSLGGNLSDDAACAAYLTGTDDLNDVDAMLDPAGVQNNGGVIPTVALLTGSPAINGGLNSSIPADTFDLDGNSNTAESVPFDARGAGFARVIAGKVDIGAYEASVASGVTLVDASPNPMQEGSTATYSIVLNAPPNAGETVRIQPRGFNSRFISVSPSQLVFTNVNWYLPQIITITAPDDPLNRGVRYQTLISHVLTTNGAAYVGITVDRLRIIVSDNDLSDDQDQAYYDALNLAAWLEVSPGAIPAGTASVGATVRLNGQPMPGEIVVVNLYVGAGVTVSPSQLVFTEHNWDIPQPVTLIASAEGSTALQVVVDANSTTSPEFIGAAQAVSVTVLPAGTSVTPAEQPAAPFVPAPEASAETNEGSVSE